MLVVVATVMILPEPKSMSFIHHILFLHGRREFGIGGNGVATVMVLGP